MMDNKAEYLSTHGRALLNRREFLRQSGMTMGAIGLAHLLAQDKLLAEDEITVSGRRRFDLRSIQTIPTCHERLTITLRPSKY